MNEFFLRMRVIMIALLFILVFTAFFVFPELVKEAAETIQEQNNEVRVGLVAAAVLVDGLLLWVIVQEGRLVRQNVRGLLVRSGDATAKVSLESVQRNLEAQIVKLEDIFAAQAEVQAERGRVLVELEVEARDTIDVRKKTREINRDISRIVDKQLGLRLGAKPIIKFNLYAQPPETGISVHKSNL